MILAAKYQSGKTTSFSETTKNAVEAIVGEDMLDSGVDLTLMKSMIVKLLSGDKDAALHLIRSGKLEAYNFLPDQLKKDDDVISELLAKEPVKFFTLAKKYQSQKRYKQQAITSFLQLKRPILDSLRIIEESPRKWQEQLVEFTDAEREKYMYEMNTCDLITYQSFKTHPEFYKIIKEKKVFQTSGSHTTWSSNFIAYVQKKLKKGEFQEAEELSHTVMKLFYEYIGKLKSPFSQELEGIIVTALGTIQFAYKQWEQELEENEGNPDEETESIDVGEDDNIYTQDSSYQYTRAGTTTYVSNHEGITIGLDSEEIGNVSEKALEKYFLFYKLSSDLGLGFLLARHKSRIELLTGVNFLEGEGMSEARILKYLNNVGKNIGIPESSYEDAEGNREVLCFQTLGAAKMHFRGVKDSGKIGQYNFDVSKRGNRSIVELYMLKSNIIVGPFEELSVSKWKS